MEHRACEFQGRARSWCFSWSPAGDCGRMFDGAPATCPQIAHTALYDITGHAAQGQAVPPLRETAQVPARGLSVFCRWIAPVGQVRSQARTKASKRFVKMLVGKMKVLLLRVRYQTFS
eukprot:TRINITY_DN13784_c0_g1_i4.p2 TRINITY_DN13784_c0_g1~~TRINITY_DN13784_c0_g1_i4.p2  ORF type:complete len:118 (-),score=4.56 TRINITY_DN13784_c0_g1_i4:144-497(-)